VYVYEIRQRNIHLRVDTLGLPIEETRGSLDIRVRSELHGSAYVCVCVRCMCARVVLWRQVHATLRSRFDEFVSRRRGSLAQRAAGVVAFLVKCACTLAVNGAWLVTHALCMLLPTSASLLHSFLTGGDSERRRRRAHWD